MPDGFFATNNLSIFHPFFLKLQLNLRTPFTNFCLGSPARSSKISRQFPSLAADFVTFVTAAARSKFSRKILLADVSDTAPRLALRKNSLNSSRSLILRATTKSCRATLNLNF
nr:hypothetical protein [uncultured Campylobacter sp.]